MQKLETLSTSRPVMFIGGAVLALGLIWPQMSTAQDKSDKAGGPAAHAQHKGMQSSGDPDLASQIAELHAKVAKLEAALNQNSNGTRSDTPEPEGEAGTQKKAGKRAPPSTRASAKFQNCLECHQKRPSGPLPPSHLEMAGGNDNGAVEAGAADGQETPGSGAGMKMGGQGMSGGKSKGMTGQGMGMEKMGQGMEGGEMGMKMEKMMGMMEKMMGGGMGMGMKDKGMDMGKEKMGQGMGGGMSMKGQSDQAMGGSPDEMKGMAAKGGGNASNDGSTSEAMDQPMKQMQQQMMQMQQQMQQLMQMQTLQMKVMEMQMKMMEMK